MTTLRQECQAGLVQYPDGSKGILVSGGLGRTTSEFLDLQTLTWLPKADLPIDIMDGASVGYGDSFIIVGGYYYSGFTDIDEIHYYNAELDVWEEMYQKLDYETSELTSFTVPDEYANCQ